MSVQEKSYYAYKSLREVEILYLQGGIISFSFFWSRREILSIFSKDVHGYKVCSKYTRKFLSVFHKGNSHNLVNNTKHPTTYRSTFTIPSFSCRIFIYFLFFHSRNNKNNFLKFQHFQRRNHLDLQWTK
jgi:hypothetical protein